MKSNRVICVSRSAQTLCRAGGSSFRPRLLNPSCLACISYSYMLSRSVNEDCAGAEDDDRGAWIPQHALGGHYGAVVDMAWGVDGACLQTVSEDQTSRIFTECGGHWCEVARPQVLHCPSLLFCRTSAWLPRVGVLTPQGTHLLKRNSALISQRWLLSCLTPCIHPQKHALVWRLRLIVVDENYVVAFPPFW